MDRKVIQHSGYLPHHNGVGEVQVDNYYTLAGYTFTAPKHLYLTIGKVLRSARLDKWSDAWMAQNEDGRIVLFEHKPVIHNPSNPSQRRWLPTTRHDSRPRNTLVTGTMIPTNAVTPSWPDTLIHEVVHFAEVLEFWLDGKNRAAEELVSSYRALHPYAIAMQKLNRRRAL